MLVSAFDFLLPDRLIAQRPTPNRTGSRLMHIERRNCSISHRVFPDFLGLLRNDDLLVFNDSRVIPARLRGKKEATGGEIEMLLVEAEDPSVWWTLLRPGKRVRPGTEIRLLDSTGAPSEQTATVLAKNDEGHVQLHFKGPLSITEFAKLHGEIPLPPYIARAAHSRDPEDLERYQTVFAQHEGSVAAPTAGLHFSTEFLSQVRARGIETQHVTLHVGLGTFAPLKVEQIAEHRLHRERYFVSNQAAAAIHSARNSGRRIVAIGTTALRVLESAARHGNGTVAAGAATTELFLYPPAPFLVVGALFTNFHLPQSSLLMLVSAFASPGATEGRELMLRAYAEAVAAEYRFFSYGDAMFIE